MTKGKVVLVPFPFDDRSTTKVRPAICLTDPIGPYRHTVLAFITSTIPPDLLATDLMLRPGDPGYAGTGLRVASTVRLHRLLTVTTSLIRREIGSLSAGMQTEVDERLRALFALS